MNEIELKQQIKTVIEYSQGAAIDFNIDNIYNDWKINKEKFRTIFGSEVYEYGEAQFELDKEAKENRIIALKEYFLNKGYWELSQFLIKEKDGFYDNKVIEEYKTKDGKVIPKNMKLVKAFKFFVENNSVLLHEFQTKASSIIQDNKVEGILCLSVHPLDYLSSSENTYNWRSCHSLDGAYCAGNLSYMTDKSTIVCYLKGEEDAILPNFPGNVKWNNKKWRMLLHISDYHDLMFAGRQYPFSTQAVFPYLNEIFNQMFTSSGWDFWTKWSNHYYTKDTFGDVPVYFNERYFPLNKPTALEEKIHDCSQKLHYNDLLYSSYYKYPYYSAKADRCGPRLDYWPQDRVYIGNEVKCLICGQEKIEAGAETMLCFDCELKYGTKINDTFGFCDCCGERVLLEDCSYLEYNNLTYCQNCQDHLEFCTYCGKLTDKNDMIIDEDDNYYCDYCWEEKQKDLSD